MGGLLIHIKNGIIYHPPTSSNKIGLCYNLNKDFLIYREPFFKHTYLMYENE